MSISENMRIRFDKCIEETVHTIKERSKIGELSEKTVHAVCKKYFEEDPAYQEVKIDRFFADICHDNEIIEIQTAGFDKLREKLKCFLKDYQVTVVYPIPFTKYTIWIDEETGECTKRRKSPKTGSAYDAFRELYKIKNILPNPNLKLCFLFYDTEEYRLLNGWSRDRKRGSHRFDRIPLGLVDIILLESPKDYLQFVPYELETFTTADFARCTKIKKNQAVLVCHILFYLGVIERIGKQGNAYLYRAIEP